MLTREEFNAAMAAPHPPLEIDEAFMRAAIAARPEDTLEFRIACASYLDIVVCQERGVLDEEARCARLLQWAELKPAMMAEEAVARIEAGEADHA